MENDKNIAIFLGEVFVKSHWNRSPRFRDENFFGMVRLGCMQILLRYF